MNNNRIGYLNSLDENRQANYVLYVLHSSIRVNLNLTLNNAVNCANEHKVPLYIVYSFDISVREINDRQIIFLCESLKDFLNKSIANGYKMIVLSYDNKTNIQNLINNSIVTFFDRGYLKFERSAQELLIFQAKVKCVVVEDNVVIPIGYISDKQEWAAHTLRKKMKKEIEKFILDVKDKRPILINKYLWTQDYIDDVSNKINELEEKKIERVGRISSSFMGGEEAAKYKLYDFVNNLLPFYSENRNEPSLSCTSRLSPYLHFGNISPLLIYDVIRHNTIDNSFLEQLLVRRELCSNYVYYNNEYNEFNGLPNWCRSTLIKHKKDKRDVIYGLNQLINSETHDSYWNAAMNQMVETGYMENTMRMYWGKKIIEWSKDPIDAYNTTLYLNNNYLLDGWDPNSFVGVGWCFGLHDRPWREREIFGTVRYMNSDGLKRKYNMDEYLYLWK